MQDAAVILLEHPGQYGARSKERGHEIHFEHRTKVTDFNLVALEVGLAGNARAVDQNIDPAPPRADLPDGPRKLRFVCKIDGEWRPTPANLFSCGSQGRLP